MAELLNHRHCKNCDKAVALEIDDRLCSADCRTEWGAFQKKRSRTALLFYVGGAVMIIVLAKQLLMP